MSRKLKVMWLIKGLGLGGAERLLVDALPYLDRTTFDYELAYLLPTKNDLVPRLKEADVPVVCCPIKNLSDGFGLFRLVRLLKERDVDVLHCHLPYAGVIGRLAAKLAGVSAVVYTEHNVTKMYHPITAMLNRATYRFDDVTIAVSETVAKSFNDGWWGRPRRVKVIPNGIDLSRIGEDGRSVQAIRDSLGIKHENSVVGNVANLRPEKGHTYLLESAKLVIEAHPDVTFVVVGGEKTPGILESLRERAGKLGIHDRVVFTGSRQDATDLMRTFDLFVLSSLFEGLPVALLEAMALGVPPICTAVGGIPEVISNGVNGFLVEPERPDLLARRMIQVLEDSNLRSDMAQNARKTIASRFSIKAMVTEVEAAYELALSKT